MFKPCRNVAVLKMLVNLLIKNQLVVVSICSNRTSMRNLTKLFIILLFTLIVTSTGVWAEKRPDIQIYNFDQFSHWLNRDSDSIFVINFWATWCAPCVREIPDFEKLNEKYASDKVKVLLVSLDFPTQLESRVIPFIERMNMKSHVVLLNDTNANRWIPLVSESWSGAIPATLIYGRGFTRFYEKELKYEELEKIIVPFLN